MNGYARPGYAMPLDLGLRDWGAAADIDIPLVMPADFDARIRGLVLNCTETFAGAANTALHIGATAGATDNLAIAIDAAGGDAFTALDLWAVMFQEKPTNDSDVLVTFGAPGNSVTSLTDLWLTRGNTYYISAQGGTGTLTGGIANITLMLEFLQVGTA